MCPECLGEGIRDDPVSLSRVPCSRCNAIWTLSGNGRLYILFSRHGLVNFQRFWCSDCMVLRLVVNGEALDQVRVGWN